MGPTLCAGWVYCLKPLGVWTNLIFFISLRYLGRPASEMPFDVGLT